MSSKGHSFVPSRKACEILGVHPNTLRNWEASNKIKTVKSLLAYVS
jgi:predicted site-specific integrase-resolvase